MIVNVLEAKTKLSELLRRVEEGEEVIIVRAGVPVARLTAYMVPTARRELGFFRGLTSVPDDFNEPLSDEIIDSFYT
jgi:prevent-host-death family protein